MQTKIDQQLIDNWIYLSQLVVTDVGVMTEAEYKDYKDKLEQEKLSQSLQAELLKQSQEMTSVWQRVDYDTINTLMIKYKNTRDDEVFEELWNKYLNKLTQTLTNKYVVKLTMVAKKLIPKICGYKYDDLQDHLYVLLMETIEKWNPNAPDRNTMDFAKFYIRAVKNMTGNYINTINYSKYQNISFANLDFNNEDEVQMLISDTPGLSDRLTYRNGNEFDDVYLREFRTCLAPRSKIIFDYLIDSYNISEIALQMKLHRNQIYRETQKIRKAWIKYIN